MEVELLAPAGSFESLKAAVNAGADAVYIGGTQFGARAYAENLSTEKMLEAIDYCHLHGRKLYLTVNTLLKENELTDGFYDYLLPFYERGLDAVIVQDIGVLSYIREAFPDLNIHASTQMTVTSAKGSLFLKNLGVSRVVTARELSLSEIAEIKKSVDIEIESFIHGALCYCYSGQCLFSSLIGGRSGNRGRCAQPCRLPYDLFYGKQKLNSKNERYLMSPKDICTLEILPEIIQAGVCSLKIEGRMKRPEYTAGVVNIYRKYIDKYLNHEEAPCGYPRCPKSTDINKDASFGYPGCPKSADINEDAPFGYPGCPKSTDINKDMQVLLDLYNRGGFTSGYYKNHNGREMIALNRPNHLGVPAVRVKSVKKGILSLQALTDLCKKDALDVGEFVSGKRKELLVPDEIKSGRVFHIDNFPANSLHPGQILNRVRCEKLLEHLRKNYIQIDLKEKINGKLMISLDKSVILNIILGTFCIQEEGDIPKPALKQPMTFETVKKQMLKTKDTPFIFETLEIEMEDSCFLPLQSLNSLRRNALNKLEQEILLSHRRQAEQQKPEAHIASLEGLKHPVSVGAHLGISNVPKIQVSIENINMLDEMLKIKPIFGIYLDCSALALPLEQKQVEHLVQLCHRYNKKCYYIMPHILRNSSIRKYEESIELLQIFDGILIKNFDTFQFLQDICYKKKIILDHSMYTFNRRARLFWNKQGIAYDTAPLELNSKELRARSCQKSEIIIYGHLPMMVSAGCMQKTTGGCSGKSKLLKLTDRKGVDFPVKNNCSLCYNSIYNSMPLVLLDQKEEIDCLEPEYLRLSFTIEPVEKAIEITQKYIRKFISGYNEAPRGYYECPRVPLRVKSMDKNNEIVSFTRGHFKRGIE